MYMQAKEAEAVFRRDVQVRPDNGWSLSGLLQSLKLQPGREGDAEFVARRLRQVWQGDIPETACFEVTLKSHTGYEAS